MIILNMVLEICLLLIHIVILQNKWNMMIFQHIHATKIDPDDPQPSGKFPLEIVMILDQEWMMLLEHQQLYLLLMK